MPGVRPAFVASRAMRRSRRLAVALSVCMLAAARRGPGRRPGRPGRRDALALQGRPPLEPALGPHARQRHHPVRYPDQSVVLTWGDVPDAAGYTGRDRRQPRLQQHGLVGRTRSRPIAVPEILLPDGAYWWRVRAVDAAGTARRLERRRPRGQDLAQHHHRLAHQRHPDRRLRELHRAEPVPVLEPGAGRQELRRPGLPGRPVQQRRLHGHQPARAVRDPRRRRRASRRRLQLARPGARPQRQPRSVDRGLDLHQGVDAAATSWRPADGATTGNLLLAWDPIDGAQQYEVQITDLEHNYVGGHLKVDALTSANGFVPTLAEEQANTMAHGDLWWRVRPDHRRRLRHVDGRTRPSDRLAVARRRRPGRGAQLDRRQRHRPLADAVVDPGHGRDHLPRRHRHATPVHQHPREPDHLEHLVGLARAAPRQPDRHRLLLARRLGLGHAGGRSRTGWSTRTSSPTAQFSKQTRVTLGTPGHRRRRQRVRRC